MNTVNLSTLPDEVIQNILLHANPRAAQTLGQTSTRFCNVANDPQVWRAFCLSNFTDWSGDYGLRFRLPSPDTKDWKVLFLNRQRSSDQTRSTLVDLMRKPFHRIERMQWIAERGLDVKFVLLDMYKSAPGTEYHLAQKYWAQTALSCLQRTVAINLWNDYNVGLGLEEMDVDDHNDKEAAQPPLEVILGALDLFILNGRQAGDIADILAKLDGYAAEIRAAHPQVDSFSPRARACLVAKYLLERGYIGISGDYEYHSLDHMFLGVALCSPLKNSLPLISATIYCAVARRFNLQAAPCSFPFRVHAVITAPEGFDLNGNLLPTGASTNDPPTHPPTIIPDTTLYFDPFHSPEPVARSTLVNELDFISRRRRLPNFTPEQVHYFLAPSNTRNLVFRAALNLNGSFQHSPPPPNYPIDAKSATYAASWVLALLPQHTIQVAEHLPRLFHQFSQWFPYDMFLFEKLIMPRANDQLRTRFQFFIDAFRAEDTSPITQRRRSSPLHESVKYRVGQVFRHRTRHFLAVITGWDVTCQMPDEWVVMNQVNQLDRGRTQPFYNVIVNDTTHRYIAEDNIVLLTLAEAAELDVEAVFPLEVGKYMKRWDAARSVFVHNMAHEYPED